MEATRKGGYSKCQAERTDPPHLPNQPVEPTDQASSGASQSRPLPARPAKGVESGGVGHGTTCEQSGPATSEDMVAGLRLAPWQRRLFDLCAASPRRLVITRRPGFGRDYSRFY